MTGQQKWDMWQLPPSGVLLGLNPWQVSWASVQSPTGLVEGDLVWFLHASGISECPLQTPAYRYNEDTLSSELTSNY